MASKNRNQYAATIYQMLFELATGNPFFRLPKPDTQNEFSELITKLNHCAQLWEEQMTTLHFPTPFYSYQSSITNTIIITQSGEIQTFSSNFAADLKRNPQELLSSNIFSILHKNTIIVFQKRITELQEQCHHNTVIQLIFISSDNLYLPLQCSISKLYPTQLIAINTISTLLQNNDYQPENLATTPPEKEETILFNKIYQFINNHSDEQLPSTKEIANHFGLNEFKLKQGFRNHFNTSIYHCYTNIRLKNAYNLIHTTTLPIKEIAYSCGFNDYVNFAKAFKKKYGFTPNSLKRATE